MTKYKTLFSVLLATLAVGFAAKAENHILETGKTSLVIEATKGQIPQFIYYGAKLQAGDIEAAAKNGVKSPAYPARDYTDSQPEAISVEMPDGVFSADLRTESIEKGSWEGGKTLSILCKDPKYPFFTVKLNWRSCEDADLIEAWTEIGNAGKKPVVLHRYDSAYLPIQKGDVWIQSLQGNWGAEAKVYTEKITRGTRIIGSRDGIRGSATAHAELMISLDGEPRENSGRVIGAALCYAGNFQLRMVSQGDWLNRFFAGISPENALLTLGKGEIFTTPKLAYSWSDEGLSGASRNFHRWGRKYMLAHGGKVNDILLNSWEGVYFDIKEDEIRQMAKDIADIGGELFVLDDGWFGSEKYPRDHDRQGLGDWGVLSNKLPHGIQGMVDACKDAGVKFGIWIEPEMVNTTSELFEKHPDWVINVPGRELAKGRGGTQMTLDLGNPAVQDFVFGVLDGIMKQAPGVAYIKWDCNNSARSTGSTYTKNQNHVYIEYMKGLIKVLERVRAAYPDLIIQDCSSGGARVNYGVLPWFDEFWTSDNTDALQRISIQWGTSYFFPAEAMACHVSDWRNHQTGRLIPLKYRIDVAMSGRLGFELQPATLNEEEKAICRAAVADYKRIREIVQLGDIYRLVSPYENKGVASLLYTDESRNKAAFFWWRTEFFRDEHPQRVPLAGLDPDKNYRITELNKVKGEPVSKLDGAVVSGAYLMNNGFHFPEKNVYHGHNDWHSHVILLEAE